MKIRKFYPLQVVRSLNGQLQELIENDSAQSSVLRFAMFGRQKKRPQITLTDKGTVEVGDITPGGIVTVEGRISYEQTGNRGREQRGFVEVSGSGKTTGLSKILAACQARDLKISLDGLSRIEKKKRIADLRRKSTAASCQ